MKSFFDEIHFNDTFLNFKWEVKRLRARFRTERMKRKILNASGGTLPDKLHLGSGKRRITGWLNVDISDSDLDLDLGTGKLPFLDHSFIAIVSQHVIEHLRVGAELDEILNEARRCLQSGGEIWLSCPDIKKVCEAYLDDGGKSLLEDRLARFPDAGVAPYPPSHVVNKIFFQDGEHKNLMDFSLLYYLLNKAGFIEIVQVREEDLLRRFPEFPVRRDDLHSIYVRAIAPEIV